MRSDPIDASRMEGRVRLSMISLVLVMALAAAACGHATSAKAGPSSTQAPATAKPRTGGSLVVGIQAETNGWSPALDEWADTGNLVGSTVLEPLATTGTDTGAKPWLAKSWYPNATFDKWVVNLQPGVTFQDGEPFNADAVVLNFNTEVKGPLTGLALGPMFKGIKALNDTSVEIDLTQPWAAFPSSFLTGDPALMMAPAMINSAGGGVNHPIGTGPFSFESWTPGDTFTVKKNPTYWGGLDAQGKSRAGQGLPYLDQIEFKVVTDDVTRTAALQDGDLNMEYTGNAADANSLARNYTVLKDWDTEQAFIMTNTAPTVDGKPNPMSNIHARMALAYATNTTAIARQIGVGVQVPTSPWSPRSPWGLPSSQNGYVAYNLAQAKAQVAQYDHDTGQTGLALTLSGVPSVQDARTLQAVQAQWRQAGIDASIQTFEQTAYITRVATGDFQASFFPGGNYGFPDPDEDYYFWSSSTAKGVGNISINFTQYATAAIDKDLNTGRGSGYVSIRRTAYHDLAKQLNAGFTNIWMYSTPYSYIAQKKVQGLDAPGGPSTIPFGNFTPKTWWANIWLQT
jgi:peptide/nickel transport system substrate-binding protein